MAFLNSEDCATAMLLMVVVIMVVLVVEWDGVWSVLGGGKV